MKNINKIKGSLKGMFLGFLSILLFVLLFVQIQKNSLLSEDIQKMRTKQFELGSEDAYLAAGALIDVNKDKIETIQSTFIDEDSVIEFIKIVDGLKAQGLITFFSFSQGRPIKDDFTGLYGLPFTLEISGNKDVVNSALTPIVNSPYLVRSVLIEIEKNAETSDVVYKYGGYLYVKESFAKNK